MNLDQCLSKMKAPGQIRPMKAYKQGVIQIHVTRACDKACYGCTQGSNLGGKSHFMPPDMFENAVLSLKGYFGVVGTFGGNAALSPHFEEYCEILKKHIPFEQRGLWCNHPKGKGKIMATTFNPKYSNLNVHLDREAEIEFKRDWPTCITVGLIQDSRHSPPWVAMKDLETLPLYNQNYELWGEMENTEENRHHLISDCDINQKWSAMMGMFRGELRAWFCEVAGAQSILHQDEPDYPDTGIPVRTDFFDHELDDEQVVPWWQLPMSRFSEQVRKHCHECGIPLRGYGELSQRDDARGIEQVSATHQSVFKPKRIGRRVELVTTVAQLECGKIIAVNEYLQNARK